jgi:excisionase family DNA binding protein
MSINRHRSPGDASYMSVAEAAKLLGVSERSIRAEIHDGVLPALRIRGRYRIRTADLTRLEFVPGPTLDPMTPRRAPAGGHGQGHFKALARSARSG